MLRLSDLNKYTQLRVYKKLIASGYQQIEAIDCILAISKMPKSLRRATMSNTLKNTSFTAKLFMGAVIWLIKGEVFEPRLDSEFLCTELIRVGHSMQLKRPTVLELGVGSGAQLLSIAKGLKAELAIGLDLNDSALLTSRINSNLNHLSLVLKKYDYTKIQFISDVVIFNPPYLTESEYQNNTYLDPKSALVGGLDGLDHYRHMAYQLLMGYWNFKLMLVECYGIKKFKFIINRLPLNIKYTLVGDSANTMGGIILVGKESKN